MKRSIIAAFCLLIAAEVAPAQTGQGSLASLIQKGDRKSALAVIRAGADVNEAQPDGTRPIHWAVYRVDYELLDALIANKAKADVTNEFGDTPLAEAVKVADARMVKTLLDAGAGPEGANLDGETALMLAIKSGELSVVRMLVNAGANVNTVEKEHRQTPLMYAAAAKKNPGEMVKLLLSKGADVKARALSYDWPSHISEEPRVQYHPFGGLTALLYAARDGCYDCVEALIAAGADPNAPTPEGVTPLMIALDNDNNDIAKLLLDRGANPGVWDWYGRTALFIAVDRKVGGSSGGGLKVPVDASHSARSSAMDIIRALLAANVDVNPELRMHRPTRGGYTGRFSDPLQDTGCTPLLRAVLANDIEIVQLLLAKGASPNIKAMGLTSFLVAAGAVGGQRGGPGAASAEPNIALLDLLVKHGADVNAQVKGTKTYSMRIARTPATNEGMTALHIAAQAGRADLVRYLLEKGADSEIADSNGHKPIDLVNGATGNPAVPAKPVAGGTQPAGATVAPSGGPGGRGVSQRGATAANAAEIRALLKNARAKKP
ncbi:MAG: ankyrin repeat domain-containing protein [Bryobacterales bacterium]|nr:ankyrin repeat domain-containing protein [Bryobacterales bacterium]